MESWPAGSYYCPRDRNHKFDSKDRLIKHLSNCKLLKGFPEFYSCAFDTYHLFVSSFEKDDHQLICTSRSRHKDPDSMITSSHFMFQNPGFDAKFVPKKVDTEFYNKNKDRLEQEEKDIKEFKSKIRINVTDVLKSSSSLTEQNVIPVNMLFDNDVVVKLPLKITNQVVFEEVSPEFDPMNIYLATKPKDSTIITSKGQEQLTEYCIGEVSFDSYSSKYKSVLDRIKDKIISNNCFYTLKDHRENIFCIISSDNLLQNKLPELGLGFKSLAMVWLLKSELFKKVLEKSRIEKEMIEENNLKSNDIKRLELEIVEVQESKNSNLKKSANSIRIIENLKRELSALTMRLVKEDESSSHSNIARFNTEIESYKTLIAERQVKFQEEQEALKNQTMSEYLKVLVDCLLSSNDKLQDYTNHIKKYEENIGSLEAYNKDSENVMENWKQKIAEDEASLEEVRESLARFKDPIIEDADTKKGLICHRDVHCHMCKSTYASMVTRPCNHCILCWNCFHGFVQSGLRGCPLCETRVEFVFKIKYT